MNYTIERTVNTKIELECLSCQSLYLNHNENDFCQNKLEHFQDKWKNLVKNVWGNHFFRNVRLIS